MSLFQTDTSKGMWVKIFSLYYNMPISNEFISYADKQLTSLFIKETGLTNSRAWLNFDAQNHNIYQKGEVSSLLSSIMYKYGTHKIKILWQSKSGRIYNIDDTDIDEDDIRFWFEGLDLDDAKQFTNPVWSLFIFPDVTIRHFELQNQKITSLFLKCADSQLTTFFELATGIKVNQHVSMSSPTTGASYVNESTTRLDYTIYINHNWNPITIAWSSKSGRVYKTSDEDIDSDDIQFWIEGLEPLLYHKQLYPKQTLPFKLKDISYDLQVVRLNLNQSINLYLKEDYVNDVDSIFEKIDKHIAAFNESSEKKGRKDGVIHNWDRQLIDKSQLSYDIDMGSAGFKFFKKLLQFLSTLKVFDKVIVE